VGLNGVSNSGSALAMKPSVMDLRSSSSVIGQFEAWSLWKT
jgi:hypothetical protein